jgi:hypothetical protein
MGEKMKKLTLDVWKDPKTGEWILSKGDDIIVGLKQITSDTMRQRIIGLGENSRKIALDTWKDPKTGEWILSKGDKIIVGLRQITSDTMRRRIRRLLDREEQ